MLKSGFIAFLLSILFHFSSLAQVKLPDNKPQPKPAPPKQTSTKTETKPVYTGSVFTLKVMSNVDCKFYVDGEYKATITDGSIERITLKAGEYQLKAVSTENSADVLKQFYKVEKTGMEKFYEVDLKTIAEERQRKEATEQTYAQKIAAEKAAQDKIAREKAMAEQAASEKAKAEKVAREKAEAARLNSEKTEAQKAAQAEAERERAEMARLAAEKAAIEKAERQEAEAKRLAAEKAVREQLEKEKAEAARVAAEKAAYEKAERERIEAQRLAAEKAAKEKAEEEARKIAEQKALEFSLNGFTIADDFNDNKNEWSLEIYNNRRMIIADGKFVAQGLADNYSYRNLLNFPVNLSKDFSVEASVRWIEGAKDNGFGIDFCSNEATKSYYSFQIASMGYYSVIYHQDGNWNDVIEWTDSKYINRGNEPNTLKVEKLDDYLLFFANGELLKRIPWNGGYGTDFGFRIFDKQVVEYDDFILKAMK